MSEHSTAQTVADRIDEHLPGFRLPSVPRRFAICTYTDDEDTPTLLYWGLQTDTTTLAFSERHESTWHASSAQSIYDSVAHAFDAELLWLDPPTPPLDPPAQQE